MKLFHRRVGRGVVRPTDCAPGRMVVLEDSTHPTSRKRSGWTLIELLATISVLGVVMTLSGTMFVAMSRSERNALRSCAAQQTLARLNEQFRRDVHQADAVEITETDPGQFTLTLAAANSLVSRYAIHQHDLQRLAAAPDGEHRETYRIPDAVWSFQRTGEPAPKVSLTLQRPADTLIVTTPDFLPVVAWRLEAVLGLSASPALRKGGP